MNHARSSLAAGALFAALAIATQVSAGQLQLEVAMGKPAMKAGEKTLNYLKVGLTGFEMKEAGKRVPVNVAIVLDKSGSMEGERIEKAKEAALEVLDRLNADDILSMVAYADTVEVLVPATKLTDKKSVREAIRRLNAGGSTALFAGVSKGADEVRKFFDRNRVNRVVLLSDGKANVGPESPSELGALGASLKREGISVTTLGLGEGYNEDLMTALASKSDGNHGYVRSAGELKKFFGFEFGDVLSVVAQEVVIKIECAKGVRPVRVLGRPAEITGQSVIANLNQVYANQEKYVLLEVEVPADKAGAEQTIATVAVSYANMATKVTDKLTSSAAVRFVESSAEEEKAESASVMINCTQQIATGYTSRAIELRDAGRIDEAEEVLKKNAAFLCKQRERYNSPEIEEVETGNNADLQKLRRDDYDEQRKEMYQRNMRFNFQTSY